MKNRQNSKWGDFGGGKDFCAQARSTKLVCGPRNKLIIEGKPGGGRDRYDQCCTKTCLRDVLRRLLRKFAGIQAKTRQEEHSFSLQVARRGNG
jgi:hypothetical protein